MRRQSSYGDEFKHARSMCLFCVSRSYIESATWRRVAFHQEERAMLFIINWTALPAVNRTAAERFLQTGGAPPDGNQADRTLAWHRFHSRFCGMRVRANRTDGEMGARMGRSVFARHPARDDRRASRQNAFGDGAASVKRFRPRKGGGAGLGFRRLASETVMPRY